MDSLRSVDSLSPGMRDSANRFVQRVRVVLAGHLRSVTLFGRALDPDFDPADGAASSVVVVDRVVLDNLRRLAEHGPTIQRWGFQSPLIMTPEYIRATLDTFPLEFMEIAQRRRVVDGGDEFNGIEFERSHVRLQCERELKTALIALRQGLLSSAARVRAVEALELDVGDGLVRTLRGLAWLAGRREHLPTIELLGAVEGLVGSGLPGVRASLDAFGSHGWAEFDLLHRDVERLGEYVNAA